MYQLIFALFVFSLLPTKLIAQSPVNEASYIDFGAVESVAYGGQDRSGQLTVVEGGLGLSMVGNRVRALPLNYLVTPNTRLSFSFSSSSQGEVHAIDAT